MDLGGKGHWTIGTKRKVYKSRGQPQPVLKSRLSKDLEKVNVYFNVVGEQVKLKGLDKRSIDYVQKAICDIAFDAEMEKYANVYPILMNRLILGYSRDRSIVHEDEQNGKVNIREIDLVEVKFYTDRNNRSVIVREEPHESRLRQTRVRVSGHRALETSEQCERRLQHMREYWARIRATETQEQCERKLENVYNSLFKASESEEKCERRRELMCAWYQRFKETETPENREKKTGT
ncbi:hypothetical protein CEXT_312361 [Caerostris extrusa]|uniref:Uncharacterized protein n=1 Tax=Caerostris extrusa TaxID=172846 RepID=A0AAV4Y565_CAEEX|nr:hypothetical protein CEXT_312361 [Caerostris extrusa]